MKNKKQNQVASDNGANGTNNVEQGNTTALSFTDDDKEKGNLKHFSLAKKIIKKLKARNVEFLYPLQVQTYETIHDQKDCFIQAASGTGKTLAFALPLVQLLQHDNAVELADGRTPRVLVVAPTRDITKQISDEFQSFVNDLVVLSTYNAKKKSEDQDAAIANGCDVLVATPDRLKDLLEQSKIDVSGVKHVVFDEVDRMLETEVMDNLKKILKHVFTSEQETKAQLIVFSETMPDAVRKLTKKYLSDDYSTVTFASKTSATNADDEGDDDDDDDDEDADELVNTSSNKVSGGKNASSGSLLTHKENYTTYTLSVQDELKGVGLVYTMLRKCFGDDFDGRGVIPQIAFTKDYKSAVFELPSEYDEQLQSQWKNTPRIQILPITELPDIDEGSTVDNSGYSGQSRGGGGRPQRGGGGGGGGYGAGNRNSGRSSACFKCNKEGHKSFECPEGGSSQQNGGNRSGSGCFNCGKEGHRSFECTEPKKAGGRGGAGGERSNACFNCGKEGHRSFECTEPKKAGGRGGAGGERSNACFNCGQEGHRSFECTEPKKERSSFGGGGRGGGGRGGGRGGARGGGRGGGGWDGGNKRSFNNTNENGHSAGETSNKKIKFDDDDE